MQTLRDMIDIFAYGTSEGVKKEWDTRGRKQEDEHSDVDCTGPNCKGEIDFPKAEHNKPIVIPHLDGIELQMTSTKNGRNIHFDKEALKAVLRMALVQLDMEDHKIQYLNTDVATTTDHYVKVGFNRTSENIHGSTK